MTVSAADNPKFHAGDGSTTAFAFPFRIFAASHLTVVTIHDPDTSTTHALGVDYTVAGVDVVTGGTVTMLAHAIPQDGEVLLLAHVPPYEQPTQLPAAGYIDLPTIERMVDRIAIQIQARVVEELSRRPALPFVTRQVLRNLFFPTPVASKLWGWNADATGITYYDAAVISVTPDPVSGLSWVQSVVAVPTDSGESVLTAAAFLPAGVVNKGVVAYVAETFGNSNGLTTMRLGTLGQSDRWAAAVGRTAGSSSAIGAAPVSGDLPCTNAEDVIITANAGTFDGSGSLILTAVGWFLTPEESV